MSTKLRVLETLKDKSPSYISGQDLANSLGISRNSVWKAIKRLQEEGKDTGTLMSVAAEKYLEILYSNPAGFKLTARMTTNYRQLKTIYAQRKNHRLPEWRAFCEWIETLPNADFITKTMR
mgnify:CR=1 FL=1